MLNTGGKKGFRDLATKRKDIWFIREKQRQPNRFPLHVIPLYLLFTSYTKITATPSSAKSLQYLHTVQSLGGKNQMIFPNVSNGAKLYVYALIMQV